jgi:hypothetical protein
MNEENPVVRQVANIVTTLAFFALIGFLAHAHSLSEQSIAWILGAFTVGTSGVKLTKHVATGVSQARMRAVRPGRRDDPPNEGGGGGMGDVHTSITRQVEQQHVVVDRQSRPGERQTGPGPYGPGRGPGGIIRRVVVDWGPTVLVAALAVAMLGTAREPVAFAAPQDPPAASLR